MFINQTLCAKLNVQYWGKGDSQRQYMFSIFNLTSRSVLAEQQYKEACNPGRTTLVNFVALYDRHRLPLLFTTSTALCAAHTNVLISHRPCSPTESGCTHLASKRQAGDSNWTILTPFLASYCLKDGWRGWGQWVKRMDWHPFSRSSAPLLRF